MRQRNYMHTVTNAVEIHLLSVFDVSKALTVRVERQSKQCAHICVIVCTQLVIM